MRINLLSYKWYIYLSLLVMSLCVSSCGSASRSTARRTGGDTHKHRATGDRSKTVKPLFGDEKPTEKYQKDLVSAARKWIGTPYLWGGTTKEGADCSGFVLEVYKAATGIKLPRTSYNMRDYCIKIDRDNLLIGDLVFFSSSKSNGKVGHVGMYIGNNRMIHSSSSRGVIESSLDENYYVKYYHSAGRVPAIAQMLPDKKSRRDTPREQGERQLAMTTRQVSPLPTVKTSASEPPREVHSITLEQLVMADNAKDRGVAGEMPVNVTPVTVKTKVTAPETPSSEVPVSAVTVPEVAVSTPEAPAASPEVSPEVMVINAFAGIKTE